VWRWHRQGLGKGTVCSGQEGRVCERKLCQVRLAGLLEHLAELRSFCLTAGCAQSCILRLLWLQIERRQNFKKDSRQKKRLKRKYWNYPDEPGQCRSSKKGKEERVSTQAHNLISFLVCRRITGKLAVLRI
jgi:hypothetical protein